MGLHGFWEGRVEHFGFELGNFLLNLELQYYLGFENLDSDSQNLDFHFVGGNGVLVGVVLLVVVLELGQMDEVSHRQSLSRTLNSFVRYFISGLAVRWLGSGEETLCHFHSYANLHVRILHSRFHYTSSQE